VKKLRLRSDALSSVPRRALTHLLRATPIAALSLLVGVSQAGAAPATIGQLASPSPPTTCNGPGELIQTAVAAGSAYTVPTAGVITSWSTNAATGTGQMFKMKIFRLVSGTTYTIVAHDGPRTLASGVFNEFAVNIPVQAGDVLGLHEYAGTVPNACTFATGMMGDVNGFASTDPDDGAPETFPLIDFNNNARLNISATLSLPPGIASISPSSGSISGGTSVTVSGHDFTGATAVRFGSVPASSITVNSDTQLTAVSPPASAPGPVDLRVSTGGGTTPGVAADSFTYTACVVPKVNGKKLRAGKRKLRRADCKLGKVKGPRSGKVKKQRPKPGTVLPLGSTVKVTLG
jgi:IPT/TIG domain/PASTA domain